MANKAFVAKNGLTVNTASIIMSQLSGTLTQASGGENLTLDENGQLGTQTNAQIKTNIGAGVVETVTAGNGLTGGGTSASVTVTMGAPTTLTVSTTDTVGATTHAHAITTSSDVTGGTAAILASDGTGKLQVATINATSVQIGGTAVSSTAAEINLVDGSSAGTVVNSKAVIYGSSGEVNATTLQIGGTSITSTAAEINILDGVTSTATELNIIDGNTSASPAVTIVDADRFVLNDAGTMKQIAATDVANYIGANPADFSSAILPNASGTIDLGSATKEFNDIFLADSSVIKFGNDQEITLTHNADKGLTLKHEATGDDIFPTFTLATKQTDIQANDVLGSLEFIAPDEGSGTADQDLLAGAIRVISEGDFSDTSNASKMSFMLGESEAATEKMSLSSDGTLTINGNLTVSGTTTTVNSTTVSIADPIFELGDGTSDDNLDRGIKMKYNSSGAKIAFMGFDDSDGKFTMIPDATDTSSVFSGSIGTLKANIEATNLTGTLQTVAQGNVTSLGTLTALTVDNIAMDGSTIGHTSDTDLMTLADGIVTVAGEISVTTLDIGGTNVTSTAAELNILDGVTATASEINLIDGDTARGTTAVASGDGVLINDAGTMRMTNVDTLSTYLDSISVGGTNIVTTGAINAGSITSGFGTIDTGSSAISTTGVLTGGSIVITDESVIGTTDNDAIRIGAGGSVAFSNNTVLYGASNSTVATASTQTFSGTIGAGAPAAVVFTFKAKDGTTSPTHATNYQGGEIILTLKKGTDVETKKVMIHHDGDPLADGTDVFITEFATLGTELGETLATAMGDADGTAHSSSTHDKHVHFKITNPSGTDAMTYAGVAHLVEIPGDS